MASSSLRGNTKALSRPPQIPQSAALVWSGRAKHLDAVIGLGAIHQLVHDVGLVERIDGALELLKLFGWLPYRLIIAALACLVTGGPGSGKMRRFRRSQLNRESPATRTSLRGPIPRPDSQPEHPVVYFIPIEACEKPRATREILKRLLAMSPST